MKTRALPLAEGAMQQERMNADDPRPDHCGPSCRSWDSSEDRCSLLNEREQRINRHGNVGYFPDQASRNAFLRGHPCQPYQTLLQRLMATPLLRRPSHHETQDAAHHVLHAGIGRWLEGRAPLRVVQRPRSAPPRETIWRHDAVLLTSRWPYYYLFRDELRRTWDDRSRQLSAANTASPEEDGPAMRDADTLPSPLPGPEESLATAQASRDAGRAHADLIAQVARLDPVGAAMLADPDYPDIDTPRHAAALAAEYARLDALEGKPRGAPRKATPTDVTHRRHLAELRAAVLGSALGEVLSSRHRERTVLQALHAEEQRTQVLSRLLQGYLRAFDREGIFETFELQRLLPAALEAGPSDAVARFRAEGVKVAARGETAADHIDAARGDDEEQRVRAKKLRASSKKLSKFVERVAEMAAPPVAARPFADALVALRGHAFRPFDPTSRGPFTKLGLPASGTSAEGDQFEPLLTAACLAVLSGLLGLGPERGGDADLSRPHRLLAPRNAVRLLNVLLRDFAVALGKAEEGDEEGDEP
jgi:hypothetical protein